MTINEKIQKVEQNLAQLKEVINNNSGLKDFGKIEIPFKLTQACLEVCQDCFSISMLESLANDDPETLELWAISLNMTLGVQLDLLNQWLPLLDAPPPKLKEKAVQRIREIQDITEKKSSLISVIQTLSVQASQWRQAVAEISDLQNRQQELEEIQSYVDSSNLEVLKQKVFEQEKELIPKKQVIDELNQQQINLDNEIKLLEEQQEFLIQKINDSQMVKNQKKLDTLDQLEQLISLTRNSQERLDQLLIQACEELDSERKKYNELWEKLQEAITLYNDYNVEIKSIQDDLKIHYETNVALGEKLPIERGRIEVLIQNIQSFLNEVDQELERAYAHHERLQQKQYITFGSTP